MRVELLQTPLKLTAKGRIWSLPQLQTEEYEYTGEMPEGKWIVGDTQITMRLDCNAVPGFWAEIDMTPVLSYNNFRKPWQQQDEEEVHEDFAEGVELPPITSDHISGTLVVDDRKSTAGQVRAAFDWGPNGTPTVVLTHSNATDFRLVVDLGFLGIIAKPCLE